MLVGGFQGTTLIDYPGKIASTIFTCGCNFRCPFCHNPELVFPKEHKFPCTDGEEVLKKLNGRQTFIDGVCITGGEPTLNDDLPDFIKSIKKMGYAVKLDTNGYKPDVIERLMDKNLIDAIAMDIKSSFDNYSKVCGTDIDVELIKKSIEMIMNSGLQYEFRTTVVPEYVSKEDIDKIVSHIEGAEFYALQQFHKDKVLAPDVVPDKPYEKQFFYDMLKKHKGKFKKMELRGVF